MFVAPQLLEILVCPRCRESVEPHQAESSLVCPRCRLRYPVRDGIPIMLVDEARPL